MKNYKTTILASAALVTLLIMAGCAEKKHMGMDNMKKEPMAAKMTADSDMKKMDTMKTEMDESMSSDMEKME